MSEKIRAIVPGEQLVPGKPWLRRMGDRVIRYVRQTAESPDMRLWRNLDTRGSTFFADRVLGERRSKAVKEFDLIESIGVPVVERNIEIDWVPVFESDGEASGYQRGLKIETPLVDGVPMDRYLPRFKDQQDDIEMQLGMLCASLSEYIEYKAERQEPFLGDILGLHQYMVENNDTPFPDLVLVDTDPVFARPTTRNFNLAFQTIEANRQILSQ